MSGPIGVLRNVAHMRARGRLGAVVVSALLVVAACARPGFSVPPDSAPPEVVLATYLRALVVGDCAAGKALGTATFRLGNGELCGATSVSSFTIQGPAPDPNATELVFATMLVTTGTADGSIQPGSMTWFYDLRREPDGSWRLVGGGSGP
jgi:hypothetical protein